MLTPVGSKGIKLVLISSNWIKKDQNESDWLFGSNQIKLVQIGLNQISNYIDVKIKIGSNLK